MGVFLVVGWEVVKDVFVCVGGWVLGFGFRREHA